MLTRISYVICVVGTIDAVYQAVHFNTPLAWAAAVLLTAGFIPALLTRIASLVCVVGAVTAVYGAVYVNTPLAWAAACLIAAAFTTAFIAVLIGAHGRR
jgi:hypothetical protein